MRFAARKPADFENPTIQFSDLPNALTPKGWRVVLGGPAVGGIKACIGCLTAVWPYTWVLIYDFLAARRSSILGVWAAPGGREALQKGGGFAPHLFGRFPGRPRPPRPPKSTISGQSKNQNFMGSKTAISDKSGRQWGSQSLGVSLRALVEDFLQNA